MSDSTTGEILPVEGFEISFDYTNDPRKGVPYAARLIWSNGQIQREFYELERTRGRKSVTVYGTFRVRPGEVIEMRTGGSWNNDYRSWYLVRDDGTLRHVTDAQSSYGKSLVERYLRGTASVEIFGEDKR